MRKHPVSLEMVSVVISVLSPLRSAGAWSDCDVSNQTSTDVSVSCGTGNQGRDVTCVERDTMNNYIQTVNDTFCDDVRRPAASRNCDLPCPG